MTSSITSQSTGTITSLGIGSGLDANSIVTKLVSIERQPITDLQAAADKIQTKISEFGKVQSTLSSLGDAARTLANPAIWNSTIATSADTSVVNFTTADGASAGSYNVTVSSLAAAQSIVTNTSLSSANATVGSGTLTIDMGSWSNNTFTPGASNKSISVSVAATDTLQNIADKINGSGADVLATIVNDSSGARLSISSRNTGTANGFRITATDTGDGNNTDNAGLSSLAYDPANSTAGTKQTQAAADAAATINGVAVTSGSNTLNNVLNGVTVTLSKVSASPVNVSISADTASITKAINTFASAYSAMATLLTNDTKYDASSKTAGPLQADSTAVGVLNQLRSIVGGSTGASSVFSTLSSVGLEIQADGTLSVNSTKLTNAMGNLAEMKKLFSNADLSGTGNDGIATQLRTYTDGVLGFDGALTTHIAGLNQDITDNQKQQSDLDARVQAYQARLQAQYTALDTTMANLNGQSSYVTQMINSYNRTGG